MWMNPTYGHLEKKIYDEVADMTTIRHDNIEDVFTVWHNNKSMVEEMPPEAVEQMQIEDQADNEE
jgi:hypothetical protein